jgi:NitT/TauT family transport system permease protein
MTERSANGFRWGRAMERALVPVLLLAVWHAAVALTGTKIFPSPADVVRGVAELVEKRLLWGYIADSLYRVGVGYTAAVLTGIPAGMLLGWYGSLGTALNPVVQMLRPISPLAWIPISILWFGVGDVAAIFLIFLASFFPLFVTAMVAVRNVDPVYSNAGRNFGLSQAAMITRIVVPSILPQLLIGLRITLGIAWLVVVAAEMIAVNSGLGFLIVDARNAGNRYDLVVAGMVMIGLIGLLLDLLVRRLERLRGVRWGYATEG